jgi:hypothetical protein
VLFVAMSWGLVQLFEGSYVRMLRYWGKGC